MFQLIAIYIAGISAFESIMSIGGAARTVDDIFWLLFGWHVEAGWEAHKEIFLGYRTMLIYTLVC